MSSISSPSPGLPAALERHIAGDLVAAEAGYRQLLSREPRNGNAWNLLGVLLHQTARSAEAAAALQQATELLPGFADAHSNRAMVALDIGDLDVAGSAIERALQLAPAHPVATRLAIGWHRAHGSRCFAAGDFAGALAEFSQARQIASTSGHPDSAELLLDLANTLRRLAKTDEALPLYRGACALATSPASRARCQLALAAVLRENGQWIDALAHFRLAATHDAESADAWQGAGVVLMEIGRVDEALPCLRRAVDLAPGQAGFHSALLGALNYVEVPDAAAHFAAHLEWAARHAAHPPSQVLPERGDRSPPWRIGLLSADLREHPVARFIESWLPEMASRPFEFFVYSDVAVEDETSRRLQRRVAGWKPVRGLDDATLAQSIADDRLDLLIELSGHTAPNRLPVLAAKPVPIIWSWIGYPATTGLQQVDGRLTDSLADPPGSESCHTERLIRLPNCFLCYAPPPEVRQRSPAATDPSGEAFVFGSFNNLAKLTPRVVAVWSAILLAVPASRLRLKSFVLADSQVATEVRARFAAHGVRAERLQLSGFVTSVAGHFAQYDELDLALDPFPYNGTTTTCDALWMGVPVLVRRGCRHAGRVGVSLLTAALGIEARQWIADDDADYVRRAVDLAAAGRRTSEQRQEWRRRVEASTLMNNVRFAVQFEAVLIENLAVEKRSTVMTGAGRQIESK